MCILLAWLLIGLPALESPARAVDPPPPADESAEAGQWLVTTGADATPTALRRSVWTRAMGVTSVTPLAERVTVVRSAEGNSEAVVALLAATPGVVAVEPNRRRSFQVQPDDPSFPLQWAHEQAAVERAWDRHTGGAAIGEGRPLIAIIDSGTDATHPDLADVVVSSLRAHEGKVVDGPAANDCIGHGTAVTGVTAARGDNGFGVTGVVWNPRVVAISLVHELNGCPAGPDDVDTITAMNHVSTMAETPLVMNLSLGSIAESCPAAYQAAIDQALAAGIVVVASAGNNGNSRTQVPASCNGVISVSAVSRGRQRASYAAFNPHVDITAPGGSFQTCPSDLAGLAAELVLTTSRDQPKSYAYGTCQRTISDPDGHRLEATQGTSFAAPYVTGAVALLRQYAIDRGAPITPAQTEALLEQTAVDLGPSGRDDEYGWGLLDVAAAMDRLEAGPPGDPIPDPEFAVSGRDVVGVERITGPGDGVKTDPVALAVAISQQLPDHSAPHAVLARVDDFADALAGAPLGGGIAPLLFTSSTGRLDPRTRVELRRVLTGSTAPPRVYVMGGPAAIPSSVDTEIEALGAMAIRVGGSGREATAARVADMIPGVAKDLPGGRSTRNDVFLVSGRDFADAVAAGQMAAHYLTPILVTNGDRLHPAAAAALDRIDPDRVWVVGGRSVIDDTVLVEVDALGHPVSRLAGETRVDTALLVFDLYADQLAADLGESLQQAATIAVNLRASFTDALAATVLAGQGSWFFPLDAPDGSLIAPAARSDFCRVGGDLFVIGGRDHVSDATAAAVREILDGVAC